MRYNILKIGITVTALWFALASFIKERPVLYIIGDSTVATGSSNNPIQGWGGKIISLFDTTRVKIQNRAVSGTSTRTYLSKGVHDRNMLKNGMWDSILVTLKPGDFVLMQFGHNDESAVVDSTRMRGTIKGIGTDSVIVFNPLLNRNETVHSYGWYLEKIITDVRNHGATPIVCSPIPKNFWKNGKVIRNNADYGKWASEVAHKTHSFFIDLNRMVADKYDADGQNKVDSLYFVKDHIHNTAAGAELNASLVAKALRQQQKPNLTKYLKK
ncbi:MAG: rhamnogalacturonan acetylesterase [Pedobacter sp.]|nr:MAG: rhamnogalacturonan acetylesterase [Pedobacter sp.]